MRVDRGTEEIGKQVRVWSTIGVKVPVPDLDYTMVEFSFGHERWARSSSQEEIANAGRLVEEFNTQYLAKHLPKLLRDVRRIDAEVSGTSKKSKKNGKQEKSVAERVAERMGKGK